jgi:hypothetical protein
MVLDEIEEWLAKAFADIEFRAREHAPMTWGSGPGSTSLYSAIMAAET